MKRLNNRGITTIEVIVCFVLVVLITVIMYSTISSFNEKRLIEGYKSRIYTYKNVLTKEIQDDFIKIGLTHATVKKISNDGKATYTVNCDLQDGTRRKLIVDQRLTKSDYHLGGNPASDDYFMIQYGKVNSDGSEDLIKYPLPDLGESEFEYEKNDHTKYKTRAKNLSLNNIIIEISESNVLSIYIGLYHPELGTRYAINIVAPINYQATEADATQKFGTP